jgi:membrane protease YdiL (CAAX protease family)
MSPRRRWSGWRVADIGEEIVDDTKKSLGPVLVVLAVLAVVNFLTNRTSSELYVAWAWLGVGALIWVSRRDGESWSDIGLGKVTKRALVASTVVVLLVLLVYLVAIALPWGSDAFSDDRVSDLSSSEILFRALVRVPFGTVLLEEVAFRGVLLAMLWRRIGTWPGIIASSLVFGLWHVLPSLGITQANDALGEAVGTDSGGRVVGVLLAVLTTFVAGIVFCELRRRFDHLIVPMALHWATNGLGYLFAWVTVTGLIG